MSEIDHRHTNNITCPHCGHEESNSQERLSILNDSGTDECNECGMSFFWQVNFDITYTTRKEEA